MAEQSFICPNCGKTVQLTEALTGEIEKKVRATYDRKVEEREQELKEELAQKHTELEAQAKKQAEESLGTELKDLKSQIEEKSEQLKKAQKLELDLRKRERLVEQKAETVDLEVVRRVDQERQKIQNEAVRTASEGYILKLREKDEQLKRVSAQIEELKKKAEDKSQELQGEVFELEFEDLLRSNFPFDDIEPIKRGKRGADVLHKVHTQTGQHAGTILWECKRTKAWSAAWIRKLKDDQRRQKADFGVIVSEALPDTVTDFGSVNDIWVTAPRFAAGLATVLRQGLIDLAQARTALVDKSDKMDLLYNYLSGSQFKQRVEPIVESFIGLQEDLEREKRAMETVWAKREKQIERALAAAAGMYGDLQGIIGASLPPVKTLELPSGTE